MDNETIKQSNTKETIKPDNSFEKSQFIQSIKYRDKKDLLNVILEDNKIYTVKEVDKLINDFMKAKVK